MASLLGNTRELGEARGREGNKEEGGERRTDKWQLWDNLGHLIGSTTDQ